ncbi:hypothetical protein [Alkalihalobacillus sp. 1P02AB]|uniref:hypothetical protein n=1 Tax=Alkalihalobacillus sp. 1P02AB TaxID=3132260 RepID=UPI0039A565B9
MSKQTKSISALFQEQKQHISLLSRNGLDTRRAFPMSIRQTNFPLRFEQEKK